MRNSRSESYKTNVFTFRHLLQEILQFRVGVDEARPVGEDHVEGN